MTYAVAIKVDQGLVFAADTRTTAGIDDVRTYNKLHVFEFPGERCLVLLSAGNLATTQAVIDQLGSDLLRNTRQNLRKIARLTDIANYVGELSVKAQQRNAQRAGQAGISLETTFVVGGELPNEAPGLHMVYALGNTISASPETPYLQIGENKYGKPILDRIIRPGLPLEDAARCALVSLDSTMRSNLSVGPPLDLAIIRSGQRRISHRLRLDLDTPYYAALRESWARRLESVFRDLPRFDWELNNVSG